MTFLYLPVRKTDAERFCVDPAGALDALINSGGMRAYLSLDLATAAHRADPSNADNEIFAVVQIAFGQHASDAVLCSTDAPTDEYWFFNGRQIVPVSQLSGFRSWKFYPAAVQNLKQHALQPDQIWVRFVTPESAEADLQTWLSWAKDAAGYFNLKR